MHTGKCSITELTLEDGYLYARVSCPEILIPAPGQYLLASDASDTILSVAKYSPLPVPAFYTDSALGGFIALAASHWKPGDELYLRGPLGRGFSLPQTARKIVLIAYDDAPARLRGLIRPALLQDASVVLISSSDVDSLPDEVEVQPLAALSDALEWADYVAMDVSRENLPELKARLFEQKTVAAVRDAEVLVRTPMPCGGIADCGVCAVVTKSSWKMACKDGPVFDWREI
jgi:dihydroorotate dehydrogenase electron transfer subunit